MKTGIGILGCGYWGPHFIRIVNETDSCKLLKVCDINPDRVEQCKKIFSGVSFTTSLEDILNDPSIEAVIISTPAKTHYALAMKCASAKKHILCEKPMTYSSSQAKKLIAHCLKNKVLLMPGHVFEFNAVVRYMQQMITKGKLGDVLYINMFRTGLGPIRSDVNVVYDLAAHDITILNTLLGCPPLFVSAIGRNFLNSTLEDIALINFEFPGDVIASLTVSWMDPIKQRLVKVVGTKRMLLFDDVSTSEKLKVYSTGKNYQSLKGDFGSFQLSTNDGNIVIPNIKYPEPLKLEFEHFISCIKEEKAPKTNMESGLQVVQILEAVTRSIKLNGKKIAIK